MRRLATSESGMWRPTPWLPLGLLGLLILASACSGNKPSIWERPWGCWSNSDGAGYDCDALNLSWAKWEQKNKGQVAIAFNCVSQTFEDDSDPWDFICRPVPSAEARRFEDGSMPRFHCFGTRDAEDRDTRELSCSPYWNLKPAALRELGSGWFLWRSLVKRGREGKELFGVAERLERAYSQKVDKDWNDTLRSLSEAKPRGGSESGAKPGPGLDLGALIRQLDKKVQAAKQREEARTAEEIAQSVAAEEKAWRSGAIVGDAHPGNRVP